MNKLLFTLLVLTVLFGCNTKSKNQIALTPAEQKFNSKEFLITHNINTLKNKISLANNKSYPKEIFGQYMLLKTIENNNRIIEYKEKEPYIIICDKGIGFRGLDQLISILQINIVHLEHITVLKCVNELGFDLAPNIFLFDDGVLVISNNEGLMFLKKIDHKKNN